MRPAALKRSGWRGSSGGRQCWTSPALRALGNGRGAGSRPRVDERLRDCDYGRWSGLRFKQVLLREPRKLVSWIRKPETAPHGGETIAQVLQRVAAWMAERSRGQGRMVAITHSAVIRAAIVHVIQAQLPSFWRIDVLPLSQTDLRTNGRRWVLRFARPAVRDRRSPLSLCGMTNVSS